MFFVDMRSEGVDVRRSNRSMAAAHSMNCISIMYGYPMPSAWVRLATVGGVTHYPDE